MTTLELAQAVFSQPTAPFREGYVLQALKGLLDTLEIPWAEDRWGNLLAGSSSWDSLKSQRSRLLLQAHTDHPGFHVEKSLAPNESQCVWYGGAPFRDWLGAPIRLFDPEKGHEWSVDGVIASAETPESTREGVRFVARWNEAVQPSELSFGAFALPGLELSNDLIHSRAADDLAGCVIALQALRRARTEDSSVSGLILFTRAEEVGFVGCLKAIPQMNRAISTITLEASRTLPGAEIGHGPVLRIGDRSNLYNSDLSVWMWSVAQKLQLKSPQFKFQRRLMDGGSCEASAFTAAGFRASGLAVPLGNYHNQGAYGRPEPEIISLKDVEWAVDFCTQVYLEFTNFEAPSKKFKKSIQDNAKKLTPLLKKGATL